MNLCSICLEYVTIGRFKLGKGFVVVSLVRPIESLEGD